jgi:hypothetical protein
MERRYLIANKIDLEDNRRVDEETGKRVINENIYLLEFILFHLVCYSK